MTTTYTQRPVTTPRPLAAGAAPAVVLVGILDPVHHPGVGTNT